MDTGEQRKELVRFRVPADEFTARLYANSEDLLSIPAGNGRAVGERAIGELDRRSRAVQKPGLHRQGPEVTPPFMPVSVDKIAAIGRPGSAAHLSGLAALYDGMET